jgi:hypothetical protein
MGMADVALGGRLPKGDGNGLSEIASQLIDNPSQTYMVVASIKLHKIQTDLEKDEVRAVTRIVHIEVVTDGDDSKAIDRIMARQLERRTGQTVLDFDTETAINDALREGISGAARDLTEGDDLD